MAYYSLDNQENAIFQIQRILRDLEYFSSGSSGIPLNGIYDSETRDGVRRFQEAYGVNPTGVVDKETWDLLFSVDAARRDASALARSVYILPKNEKYTLYPGTKDDIIYVIQFMLNSIKSEHDDFGNIPFNGVYDEETARAVSALQRKFLLDDNAIIDAKTFNALADEYERMSSLDY